jgi:hypothetical protein
MLAKVLNFLLTGFIRWVIAVVSLLAIFILVPQQSWWFYPTIVAWFVIIGILAFDMWIRAIRNWWKSSTNRNGH